MTTLGRDPDEDVRRLLDQDDQQPGAAHDSTILRAARGLAATAVTAPRLRTPSRVRTWALAASLTVVLAGAAFEWQAIHSHPPDTPVGSSTAGLWIAPGLIDPGLTRGQREATRINLARGTLSVRLRLRVATPESGKAFDAELSTSSGRAVYSVRGLQPIASGGAVELDVDVPASALVAGSYVVTVRPQDSSDGTAADDYAFSVTSP